MFGLERFSASEELENAEKAPSSERALLVIDGELVDAVPGVVLAHHPAKAVLGNVSTQHDPHVG